MEITNEQWLAEIGKYKKCQQEYHLTKEEKDFLLFARGKGLSFTDIAKAMTNVFGQKQEFNKNYLTGLHKKIV